MLVFPMWAASILVSTNAGDAVNVHRSVRADVTSAVAADDSRSPRDLRPARRASIGSLRRRAGSDANSCTDGMAEIDGRFCIDRYEASLVEVLADGTEQPWEYFRTPAEGIVARAVSVAGVFPQGYISGAQASAACEASGKRLCSSVEWKTACMGPQRTVFPYGNQRQVGRCNDNGRSSMRFYNPQLDDTPEHGWMWGAGGNMNDPRLNQLPGTLTRTGERAECTNDYGVFDMVGNLHEWVDDPAGTFQGGYYLDTHINGDGCNYRTTAHPYSHHDYSTGFRCCADLPDR